MMEESASLKIVCKRRTMSFLELPAEIRNQIYDLALIKDAPMNLCPLFTTSVNNSIMREVVSVLSEYEDFRTSKVTRDIERREQSFKPSGSSFRLQKDLLYVRKQLAPGLLQTCRQIHSEAAGVFYSGNTWQFLYDEDWHLFFRFLDTIGPINRALIKNLEVYAPLAEGPIPDEGLAASIDCPTRNHPKLHMVKTPHCGYKRGCEKCYYGRRGCCDCKRKTFELLMREKTLEKIKFVVPRAFCVYDLDFFDCPKIPQGFLPKITLEFVPGAFLSRGISYELSVKDFTDQGVCIAPLPTTPNNPRA